MKKVLKIMGIIFLILFVVIGGFYIYFVSTYPSVGKLQTINVDVTPERIARGKYLANHVTVCIDCHSTRDWKYFSGPIIPGSEGKGGDKFDENSGIPGTLYARNITPTNLGNWSDGELIRAITSGVNKDGRALFPLMPYPAYRNLTQEDLNSIVTYIRTLKPIENQLPKSELNFPMNLIVRTIPKPYNPPTPVDTSDRLSYGKYLVDIAACGECHTPAIKGEQIKDMEFAGGFEFKLPGGVLRSSNITPDPESGIGNWNKEDFIKRFKFYASDSAKTIKADIMNEFNTVMPWTMYAGMTESDLSAIYEYLKTLKPVSNKVERFTYRE